MIEVHFVPFLFLLLQLFVGELSVRVSVRRDMPIGEMSVGYLSGRGKERRGYVRRGIIRRGSVRRESIRQGSVSRGCVRIPIYCTCRRTYFDQDSKDDAADFMAPCCSCKEWFHKACANIP